MMHGTWTHTLTLFFFDVSHYMFGHFTIHDAMQLTNTFIRCLFVLLVSFTLKYMVRNVVLCSYRQVRQL